MVMINHTSLWINIETVYTIVKEEAYFHLMKTTTLKDYIGENKFGMNAGRE